MRYLGGKNRLANKIGDYINSVIKPGQAYWEPFVGAAWVLSKVHADKRYASDLNHYLISMWNAVIDGWKPPSRVSKELYDDINDRKEKRYPESLVAFVGFGLSWGGKWFGGYARDDRGRDYAADAVASINKILPSIADVQFFTADFMTCNPPDGNMVIYCDPPYINRTQYDYSQEFDHDMFWGRARELDAIGHTVIISEYAAPTDYTCVLEMPTKTEVRTTNGREPRIEKLFALTVPEQRIKQLRMIF